MTSRQEIADALNGAAINMGAKPIVATKSRPTVLSVGVAWPKTGRWDRAEGQSYARSWQIWIVLPTDELGADDWLDDNLGDVDEALRPVVFVDSYEPVLIPTGAGSLHGVLITAHSE